MAIIIIILSLSQFTSVTPFVYYTLLHHLLVILGIIIVILSCAQFMSVTLLQCLLLIIVSSAIRAFTYSANNHTSLHHLLISHSIIIIIVILN
jgi:hypothetical protein